MLQVFHSFDNCIRQSLSGRKLTGKKTSMEYLRRFQISPLQNVKKPAYVGVFAGPKMETPRVFHGNFIFSDFPDALWVILNRKVCGKVVASLYKATFLHQFFRFSSYFVKSPPSGIGKFSETAPLKAKSFCKVISVVSTNKSCDFGQNLRGSLLEISEISWFLENMSLKVPVKV